MDAISVGTKDGLNMFHCSCLSYSFLSLVALADFILGIFPNVYGDHISSKDSSYFCSYCMVNGIPLLKLFLLETFLVQKQFLMN